MRFVAALAALAVLDGCATIFTGTTDTLSFGANVPGVRLSIDGQYMGEMPLTIPMSRNFVGGRQFIARFERPGYMTQEFRLNREFNTVAILDITSLPTSAGVDILTGSLLRFSPTEYHVQMLQQGAAAMGPGSTAFRRSTELYRYALTNYRNVQKDIARGGGAYLSSFAVALCGGEGEASALVSAEAVRGAAPLLAARTAHAFVGRFDELLAGSPALARYRM